MCPYDANGNFSLTPGYLAVAGQTIQPSQHNPVLEDIGLSGLSNVLVRDGRAPMTGALNMNTFKVINLLAGSSPTDAVNKQQLDDTTAIASIATECRLTLSGGNLLLSRVDGRRLTINGTAQLIPQAGITLAATGLTPSTLYYIYAYMNAGTMTLEASATAPATDATTGIQIKTGDATRTLVGMARPITGPAWADSAKQRFVLSYYNRVKKHAEGNFTATRSTTSGTFVEINTEIRIEFLAWGDGELWFSTGGGMATSPGSGLQATRISLDGTVNWFAQGSQQTAQDFVIPLSISGPIQPTLGYHYATLLGAVSSGTAIWLGTGGSTCFIFASIEG